MLHQKHESYQYVLGLKNWVHWITTRQEKNVTTTNMYILRRNAQKYKIKKHIFSPYDHTFYNFTLKIKLELSWAKKSI